MSLQLLVDMNLSPAWTAELAKHGWPAVHWSSVGDPRANDATIMSWARTNGYVVFTHDLDFGTTLALTTPLGPACCSFVLSGSCPRMSEPWLRPRCGSILRRLSREQ